MKAPVRNFRADTADSIAEGSKARLMIGLLLGKESGWKRTEDTAAPGG